MNSAQTELQIPAKSAPSRGTVALIAALALGTVLLFASAGGILAERNTATIILSALVFFGMLVFAVGYGRAHQQPAKWLIFIVWWGLLVSEEVFSYRSDIATVSGANFASEAYDQAVLWVIALIALMVLVLKYPQSLRGLFQGDYKWVSWLTLVSVLSCAYSPNPAFSLAWAFKLTLVVLVVHICSQQISELDDLRSFINVTIWAFVFLTVLPTLRSIFVPDPTGEYGSGALEQRFREAPTGISGIAGLLAILCLMIYSKGKPKWALWVGGGSLVIMVIAGGKTGIGAGIISGVLFFGLQKRFKAVLGFVAATAIILALALKFTSLSEYASTYLQLGASFHFHRPHRFVGVCHALYPAASHPRAGIYRLSIRGRHSSRYTIQQQPHAQQFSRDSLQQRTDRARFGPHDQLRDRSESLANCSRICLAGTPLPRCGGYGCLYQSADQCDVQCNFWRTPGLLLPDADRNGGDQQSAVEAVAIAFSSASVAGTRTPGPARRLTSSTFRIESSSPV